MDNTPISKALALQAMARSFDAQRGKLPGPAESHRPSDLATVARQLSQLGALVSDLGNEIPFRATEPDRAPHTDLVINGYAAAIRATSDAVYGLSRLVRAHTRLEQTQPQRDDPATAKTRETARRTIERACTHADDALLEAASSLHSASATISPPSPRMQAAVSRSATPAPTTAPVPPSTPTTDVAAQRPGQGR